MILNAASQAVSDRFQIGRASGEDVDQTGLRWLTCQSLVNNLIAIAIPDSGTKRRVMSEPIDIVLGRASNGHGEDAFTNELIYLVANPIGPPWVLNVLGNRIDPFESMIRFAEQGDAGIGRKPLVSSLDLDGAIEFRLKKVTLYFTHRVILLCV